MNKKYIIILIAVLVALLIGIGYKPLKIVFASDEDKITITTNGKTKIYLLTEEEKKKIQSYIIEIRERPANDVKLALVNEIEVDYDGCRIIMQKGITDYCQYYLHSEVSKTAISMAHMPKGLYDLVMKKIK